MTKTDVHDPVTVVKEAVNELKSGAIPLLAEEGNMLGCDSFTPS
jgi:hypothetical protein